MIKKLDPVSDMGKVDFTVNGAGPTTVAAARRKRPGDGVDLAKLAGNVISGRPTPGNNDPLAG